MISYYYLLDTNYNYLTAAYITEFEMVNKMYKIMGCVYLMILTKIKDKPSVITNL